MHRTLCGTAQCRLNDRSTRAFRRAHNEVATDLPSEACCGPVSSTRSRSMTTAARKSGSTNRSARHGPGLVVCRVWPAVARHCWSSSLRRSPRSRSCGFSSPGRATRCSRACDRPGSVHAGVGDPRQHDGPASRPVWHMPAFTHNFTRTGWFGDEVLWLASDADQVFRSLTELVWTAFPAYPPLKDSSTKSWRHRLGVARPMPKGWSIPVRSPPARRRAVDDRGAEPAGIASAGTL